MIEISTNNPNKEYTLKVRFVKGGGTLTIESLVSAIQKEEVLVLELPASTEDELNGVSSDPLQDLPLLVTSLTKAESEHSGSDDTSSDEVDYGKQD